MLVTEQVALGLELDAFGDHLELSATTGLREPVQDGRVVTGLGLVPTKQRSILTMSTSRT